MSRPERYRGSSIFLDQPEQWPHVYRRTSLGEVDPYKLTEAAHAAVVSVYTSPDVFHIFTDSKVADKADVRGYNFHLPKLPPRSTIFMARNMRQDLVDSFDEGLLGHVCRVARRNQINYLAGVRIFEETDPASVQGLPYSQIILAKCLGTDSRTWLAPEETEFMTPGHRLSLLALGPRFFEAAMQDRDEGSSQRVARVVADLLIQKFLADR